MWPRVVNVMLGHWLALSPFIFRHGFEDARLWVSDLACGAAIIVLELFACWPPASRARIGTALVALWLVAFGRWGFEHPRPPGAENHILLGLLILMIVIIPSDASLPPRAWRDLDDARRS